MRLWRDHSEVLIAELARLEPPLWQLGGGTLLAKAWQHRLSFDLDITIPTGVSRHTEQTVLDTIKTERRKRKLDVTNDPTERLLRAKTGVIDEHGNEAGIDIWVHDPGLPGSAPPELIAGIPVNRLSAAQNIHRKLQRDRSALVRDAYDINHAHRMDPGAVLLSDRTVGPMRPWGRSGYSASPRRAHGSRCRAQRRPGSWTESSSWDEAHEARTAKPRDIVQITTLQPGTTWA